MSPANLISGTQVTAAGAGTYYAVYRDTVNNCYGPVSASVVVTILPCCPTITNLTSDNINPSTCNGTDGSIKICGMIPSAGGYIINYDLNGIPAAPLTNQTADANGCITISGLSAGNYANIIVSEPVACPAGSNALSAVLSDPPTPASPTNVQASPNPICIGSTSQLTATCSGSALVWYTDIGLTNTTGSSVSPITTTTYYAVCENLGCKSIPVSLTLIVDTIPVVHASASPATICVGEQSTLSATGASTYVWTPGGMSGASVTVAPIVTTTYTVTGTVNGCTDEDTVTVVVNPITTDGNTSATACDNYTWNGSTYTLTGTYTYPR